MWQDRLLLGARGRWLKWAVRITIYDTAPDLRIMADKIVVATNPDQSSSTATKTSSTELLSTDQSMHQRAVAETMPSAAINLPDISRGELPDVSPEGLLGLPDDNFLLPPLTGSSGGTANSFGSQVPIVQIFPKTNRRKKTLETII